MFGAFEGIVYQPNVTLITTAERWTKSRTNSEDRVSGRFLHSASGELFIQMHLMYKMQGEMLAELLVKCGYLLI